MLAGDPEDRSVLTRPASAPDAVLAYGPDAEQVADVRIASVSPPGRPLLVVVHGGFWRPRFDRLHLRPMTEALAAAGWSTVTPEYRRVPGHPDATVADVSAAVRTVAGRPESAGRPILLVGHSAGGHLALQVAATLNSTVAGVLALAPVADLRRAQALRLGDDAVADFLGTDAAERRDLDPVRLPAPAGAVRVLHGTADGIVPIEVSEAYGQVHPAAVLTPVAGGHFGLIDPDSPMWPAVPAALHALSAAGGGEVPS
ncbi:alpha/beta hydrolase family protein [Blastococcus tunisiensis]|uniref:Alpha/beta hydrolase family protein n=1 Tax=Blastococcus tunisiensis TaxID=1798228 RepID=A0A1I2DV55_9ACTN|nr:alpha/beta hydrolase [Blastococcus sp. DSM 46838]SFE84562.1 Alpha/beta hydrolase family protein [Blastococcus sp. DSM 46838]